MSTTLSNIEDFKNEHEFESHWILRRAFIQKHLTKFPEDVLVSLSQSMINVEIIGCRYGKEVMQKISELIEEVPEILEYRKTVEEKLCKRTFVSAADAVKNENLQEVASKEENHKHKFQKENKFYLDNEDSDNYSDEDDRVPSIAKIKTIKPEITTLPPQRLSSDNYFNPSQKLKNKIKQLSLYDVPKDLFRKSAIYQNFIIFELPQKVFEPYQILKTSCERQLAKFVVNSLETECTVIINDISAGYATGDTKKICRELACELALENVRKECYTIKFKNDGGNNEESVDCDAPAPYQMKIDRTTLTLEPNVPLNKEFFSQYLFKYVTDESNLFELIFGLDFLKVERTSVRAVASKHGLKCLSRGTEDKRYLIVSKKIPLLILANNLINNGIYTTLYELVEPKGTTEATVLVELKNPKIKGKQNENIKGNDGKLKNKKKKKK